MNIKKVTLGLALCCLTSAYSAQQKISYKCGDDTHYVEASYNLSDFDETKDSVLVHTMGKSPTGQMHMGGIYVSFDEKIKTTEEKRDFLNFATVFIAKMSVVLEKGLHDLSPVLADIGSEPIQSFNQRLIKHIAWNYEKFKQEPHAKITLHGNSLEFTPNE